jgi:hypothetical protein
MDNKNAIEYLNNKILDIDKIIANLKNTINDSNQMYEYWIQMRKLRAERNKLLKMRNKEEDIQKDNEYMYDNLIPRKYNQAYINEQVKKFFTMNNKPYDTKTAERLDKMFKEGLDEHNERYIDNQVKKYFIMNHKPFDEKRAMELKEILKKELNKCAK